MSTRGIKLDQTTIRLSATLIYPQDIIDALQKAPNGWALTSAQLGHNQLDLVFTGPSERLIYT